MSLRVITYLYLCRAAGLLSELLFRSVDIRTCRDEHRNQGSAISLCSVQLVEKSFDLQLLDFDLRRSVELHCSDVQSVM